MQRRWRSVQHARSLAGSHALVPKRGEIISVRASENGDPTYDSYDAFEEAMLK